MKKSKFLFITLLLALVLIIPVQVFAASPGLGADYALGAVVGESFDHETTIVQNVVAPDAPATTTVKSIVSAYNPTGAIIGVMEYSVSGTYTPGTPVSITVNKQNVKASDVITVLHLKNDGTSEVLTATAANGSFTFTTYSFSTFAFVYGGSWGSTKPPPPPPPPGETTPASPQTGVYV